VIVTLLVAATGTYLLTSSHAANPYAATTAYTGTLTGPATQQSCMGATNSGNCVVFGGGGGGSTQTTNCMPSPADCGYPDQAATSGSSVVGPVDSNGNSVACSALTTSGSINSTSTNQLITGLNISGSVEVTSSGVTLNNDCITSSGGGSTCTNSTGPGSSHACFPLWIESGSASVTNTTIRGADASSNSMIGVSNSGTSGTMNHDYVYNCTECIHDSWTINNSYITSNGNNSAHPEDVYLSDTSFTANHDTFISGVGETTDAVFFGDTNGGGGGACDDQWTVKDSLLTVSNNGNYILGTCSNSSSAGSGALDFENNDFGPGGSNGCPGGIVWDNNCGQNGNNVGAWCSGLGARLTWTGNFRDSNGATVYCSPSGNAPTGP
jgi:hypothetical protein